jgi:peptidoglycan/xylan/chitin deacetylase (PgdA/CDA1 family)
VWHSPGAKVFAPNVSVLLYHGIPRSADGYGVGAAAFERHLQFVKRHFDCIHPKELETEAPRRGPPRVLLTFDDGFRNNAEVAAPLLRKYQVPAIFFVATGHCQPGRVLWCTYFEALRRTCRLSSLEFRGEHFDLSPTLRDRSINRLQERLLALHPYPTAFLRAIEEELPRIEEFVSGDTLADSFWGMSAEQVGELAADPLFSIGLHTVDHPDLTRCDAGETQRQIEQGKAWLEMVCGQSIRSIAYPLGAYDARVLGQCQALGLTNGYAVSPKLDAQRLFEVPRFGIYHTAPEMIGAKICWGHRLRALGLQIS